MAGNGLGCAARGVEKLVLLPMCGPPQVLILVMGGHQTWMVVWINLLQPCMHVAVSGVRAVSYLKLAMKAVRSSDDVSSHKSQSYFSDAQKRR